MARQQRFILPGLPHMAVQRGHNGGVMFHDAQDAGQFLQWLHDAMQQFKLLLHAYVLLPDQLFLLGTPENSASLAKSMQWVGRHYVPYFNRRYQRSGTLWQSRFQTSTIDPDDSFLAACQFMAQLPVRRGLCANADDYPWSSIRHGAGKQKDPMLTDHAAYWRLANTPFGREAAFEALMNVPMTESQFTSVSAVLEHGWVLGSEAFRNHLIASGHPHVQPARRGRPPLSKDPRSKKI